MAENRYMIQIRFKENNNPLIRFWDVFEPVKTLNDGMSYKSIIDETVIKARIVDVIDNKIIENWK